MLRVCSFFVAMLLAVPIWAGQPEIVGIPRVIDADTLEVSGQRIRLGGIDAPEMSEECLRADGRRWACGAWATEQARAMLAGQRVHCVDLGQRTYQRAVGRCYLDGQDIAVSLIEAGAARRCARYARAQGQDKAYAAAEARGMQAQAGVFGGPLNPLAGFCDDRQDVRQDARQDTRQDTRQGVPVATRCAIKGNVSQNGQIYHLPGQRDYQRVNMDKPGVRWFCSEEAAQAAGWRRARR